MIVRAGRDLGEMGDGEDLMMFGHAAHGIAHAKSDFPPDARVYFIEDERGYAVQSGQDRLERQHDARQLTARRNTGQRPRLEPHVEGDAILDVFRAAAPDALARGERHGQSSIGQA